MGTSMTGWLKGVAPGLKSTVLAMALVAVSFSAKALPIDLGNPVATPTGLTAGLSGDVLYGSESSFSSGVATGAALLAQYGPDATFVGRDLNYGWLIPAQRSDWFNADAGSFQGNQTPGTVHLGSTDGWYIQLNGYIYLTAGYHALAVTHDDGAVLKINGLTVINGDENTPPTTDSFGIIAGADGYYPIHIDYTQTYPGYAVLTTYYNFQFPDQNVGMTGILYHIPEPGTLALFGAALAGLAALMIGRRRAA